MPPISVSTTVPEFEVVVRELVREAERVVSLRLVRADGLDLPEWTVGSHIDLGLPDGVERQYSLCGAAGATEWRIAVLDEENSRGGSRYVCNQVQVGDRLRVRGPRNHFTLVEAPRYLFLAGGIGITPLLTMAAEADRHGRPWRMVYEGRTRGSMAFVKEIEALTGDLAVWPQDDRGLVDIETEVAAAPTGTAVYCCGPEPLIAAVEKTCAALARPAPHVQRFAAGSIDPDAAAQDRPFDVIVQTTGERHRVEVGETILGVLERAGVEHDFSCREGICGSCEVEVVEGTPCHRDFVLGDEEKKAGETMMICVSRAVSDYIIIDL